MAVSEKDKAVLRELAEQQALIAALPARRQNAAEWGRLNRPARGKPLVWINELPWHEMDVDGELALRTSDPVCREIERDIRRRLYLWRRMPGDMVVEECLYSPLAVSDTGFGLDPEFESVATDDRSDIISRHYHRQITCEADLAKIRTPRVTCDARAGERRYALMCDVFEGILPVRQRGIAGIWFDPCDVLARCWEPGQWLLDLALKPDLVHAAMDRLVTAAISRLDQWEELGVLAANNGNLRVGSGGLGYSDELPAEGFDPEHVRTVDQWGSAAAQIFSEVSPAMHEDLALRYERRWLERFGLAYYGCCEPLHLKIDIIEQHVPNLRKLSISPSADVAVAAEKIGERYVLSLKPNPAVLGWPKWHPELARKELRESLEKARGCVVEVIMKDVSTVRYEPQRLWEWAEIAAEETAAFA